MVQTLTPKELFTFAAKMKTKLSDDGIQLVVARILRRLGLEGCQDTMVGGFMRKGLSGGERKRTSIGIELISEPLMIFLDEPTTGLDSKSAENIVEICASMKNNGRTVCSTLHSPNSYMYENFDRMIILGAGKILY